MQQFWIRQGENVQGPFSRASVQAWMRDGRLTDAMLISADRVNWRVSSDAAQLLGAPPSTGDVVEFEEEIPAVPEVPVAPIARATPSRPVESRTVRTPGAARVGGRVAHAPHPHRGPRRLGRAKTASTGILIAIVVGVLALAAGLGVLLSRPDAPTDPAPRRTATGPSSPGSAAMDTRDVVKRVEGSVALIRDIRTSGTGFMVGDGLIATNAHVVGPMLTGEMEVMFPSRGRRKYAVTQVVYLDETRDLCLLTIQAYAKSLPLASDYEPERGEEVLLIGSPGMGDGTVVENAVSRGLAGPSTLVDGKRYLQVSASVNPGNSGGPVLNDRGEVIAMVTLKATEKEGIAFGVPAHVIQKALDDVKAMTPQQRLDVDVRRTASVVFRRLEMAGQAYMVLMVGYVQGLRRAMQAGATTAEQAEGFLPDLSAQVARVRELTGDDLPLLIEHVERAKYLDTSTRHDMLDFNMVVMRLATKATRPDVLSVIEYVDQYELLTNKFQSLQATLRKRLDLPDSD